MTAESKSAPGHPVGSAVRAARTKIEPADVVRAIVPPAIIIGSLLIYSTWGHRAPAPAAESRPPLIERVRTIQMVAHDEPLEISVEGVARPFRHVPVATEVAGRIRFKAEHCQEATYVQQGELLFEIDSTDYEIAVRRYTQEVTQTDNALAEWQVERDNILAQVKLSEEDVKLAARELERVRQLVGQGATSQAALDQSQRTEITSRNNLLSLRNQIRLLDARHARALSARDLQRVHLEQAQRDLERTKIVAPCNGTIVTENVEQDGYAADGATMVVINDTSAAEVACQLEFDDMYWLWGTLGVGAQDPNKQTTAYQFPRWPVTVEFPVQDLICEWDGELVRYGGTGVDPSTRTVPCQVHVSQPLQGRLRHLDGSAETELAPPPLTVGMFVTVRARLKPHTPLLKLPADAVRPGSTAWVVHDGHLRIVSLKVARRLKKDVLLYHQPDQPGSLQLGDRVVTSSLAFVQDNMPVEELPVAETPVEEIAVAATPATETPATVTPATATPENDAPVNEVPSP